jgi:hypothetical protein
VTAPREPTSDGAVTTDGRPPRALPAGVVPLLTQHQAAVYLGVSSRHLQGRADIPRLDVAPPGSSRPQWRYRLQDLEAFADSRIILPYVARRVA